MYESLYIFALGQKCLNQSVLCAYFTPFNNYDRQLNPSIINFNLKTAVGFAWECVYWVR